MKVKGIAAFDIDGTIVGPSGLLEAREKKALAQIANMGVMVILTTGRMAQSARKIAQVAGLGGGLIAYNGAWVEDPLKRRISHSPISPFLAQKVIKQGFQGNLFAYCDDMLYYSQKDQRAVEYEKRAGITGKYMAHMENLPTGPTKFILSSHPEYLDEIEKKTGLGEYDFFTNSCCHPKDKGKLYISRSNKNYLEIVADGVSKYNGLYFFLENQGLLSLKVAGIGDSDNDIPLLEKGDLSIAMGNGSEGAKRAASITVKSLEDGGVVQVAEIIENWVKEL